MSLTEHQQEAYEGIVKDIKEALSDNVWNESIISLIGPAGVGKTFMTSQIVETLMNMTHRGRKLKIKLTTPTHKSLKVAKDMLEQNELEIESSTIHSFLNLKLQPNYQSGIQELIMDNFNKDNTRVDVLIVDESSMISADLFKYIKSAIKSSKVKVVLFIGDYLQLPPVDGESNPVFEMKSQHKLNEIVRQALDNPIIAEATKLRMFIENQNFVPIRELLRDATDFGSSISIFNEPKEFMNDYFNNGNDKILTSYTNARVNKYNSGIRKAKKGDVALFVPGDELVFQDAHVDGDDIIHMNGDVITIKECKQIEDPNVQIHYWEIKDEENKEFKVIDPYSDQRFKEVLEMYSAIAKKATGYEKKTAWAEFFNIKNSFSDVKYIYASTIHKLQGSTYEDVYIDLREIEDFSGFQDMEFMYRLIYVALTRASNSVKILRY